MLDNIQVQLFDLVQSLPAHGEVQLGLLIQPLHLGIGDLLGRGLGGLKGDALAVQVDDEGTVIDLVGDGEGRVVVVMVPMYQTFWGICRNPSRRWAGSFSQEEGTSSMRHSSGLGISSTESISAK